MIKKIIVNFFSLLFFVAALVALFTSIYINSTFKGITFDQILFTLKFSEGTSYTAIEQGVNYVSSKVIIILVVFLITAFIINKVLKKVYRLCIQTNKRKINITILPLSNIQKIFFSIILLLLCSVHLGLSVGFFDYYLNGLKESTFFESNYVDAREVMITPPQNKPNLIYIVVESLENSVVSKENGGFVDISYMPSLERAGYENINFSHNDKLGGGVALRGTNWTAASLIAQTSGIPLKIELSEVEGKDDVPLPYIYTIGEVLRDFGYNNYFMLGSDADFGLRRQYFSNHGDYVIYDYPWAKENNYIPKNYSEWWGYEDKKLYTFAKEKILDAYNEGQPFNFTILTSDTHFTDGYVDKSCPEKFDIQYANSYYCADIMLSDFLKWIREQSFYDNTVIVITGDHPSMQEFLDFGEYDRHVYNIIINSKVSTDNIKNRIFSVVDLYPTTLAALGFTIDGERLGIGTNLFSEESTILEENGYEEVNQQLAYNDEFYNNLLDLETIKAKNQNIEKEKLEE